MMLIPERRHPLQTGTYPPTLPFVAGEKLSKDKLQTAEAVLSLGLIVVRELFERGVATVFINDAGEVELAPIGEIELDDIEEEQALGELLERGYTDEMLFAYLRGRKARKAHRNGQDM